MRPRTMPPVTARTLPASWYSDPTIYVRERAAVWSREWLVFAPLARLDKPGKYVAGDVAGWPLFVVVAPDGSSPVFTTSVLTAPGRSSGRGTGWPATSCAGITGGPMTGRGAAQRPGLW